ncbi:MAG: glycosyltransferase family 4 protein [Planctomycetes bacterium]|nr:glycosyltransferase family 4 protein [Planctomycetota bacterium]
MIPLRLAVVSSHPIQYHVPLIRRLAAHPRMDVTVYYCSDHGVRPGFDPGFRRRFRWDIPLLGGYRHVFTRNLSPFPSFEHFLGMVNPSIAFEILRGHHDAVLIHGYGLASYWLAAAAAWLEGIPILFRGEVRPRRADWKDTLLRFWLRRARACLAIGQTSAEFYRHYGVPQDRIYWTPYSVDNDFFLQRATEWANRKREAKRRIGVAEDLPVVLSCGKFTPRKRTEDCLRAFAKVDGMATLVLVGDGPLRADLESKARDLGLTRVFFAGFKNQTELPSYYAAADVFVMPSDCETWGLVVNEAMCFSLPIVASTGVSAARDLVRDGENGLQFAPGDVTALANHLEDLLSSPERRRQMGARSLRLIRPWSHDACVREIVRAMEDISAPTRRTRACRRPRVVVAHPGGQYSHRVAAAFEKAGLLEAFLTKRSLISLAAKATGKLLLRDNAGFMESRLADRIAVRRLESMRCDVLIGYEVSSLDSFEVCRRRGIVRVLDHAAEHWREQRRVFDIERRHGAPCPRLPDWVERRVEAVKERELARTQWLFTLSEVASRSFEDAGFPRDRITRIPLGVDLDRFRPKATYRTSGPFRILFVGNVIAKKGITYLMEAYRRLGIPEAELLLVGPMGYPREYGPDQLRGARQIGRVDQIVLQGYYQDADVFVLPSLLDSFGMVALEAMACGTPVIISRSAGASELVRDGIDGFVVEPRDVEGLVHRFRWCHEHRHRLEEMGRAARRRAEEYGWARHASEVVEATIEVWERTKRESSVSLAERRLVEC